MRFTNITSEAQFLNLEEGDDIVVYWNERAEVWDKKEMRGRKLYKILKLQRASTISEYDDEIILKAKGNIFFNFRLFLNGESKIVKEVYLVTPDDVFSWGDEMRKSYSAEMLLMFFSGLSGIVIWQGGWFILIGALFMLLTSYFLTPILKTATIQEYIAATLNTREVKK